MNTDASNWHWCAIIHADFWALDLSGLEQRAYLYLCSFCMKGYVISHVIMAKVLHVDRKALGKALLSLESRSMIATKRHKNNSITYKITTMRGKTWGQIPPSMGSNTPNPLVANTPNPWAQLPPITTNLDSEFLSLFHAHFPKWTFNRKPIGKYFVFTRNMQTKALELMRWLHKNRDGFSSPQGFHDFLTKCGEYLAHDRDVLSPARDQRALSPAKWLNDWAAQVTLVGVYIEEQEKNIVRMPISAPE